MANDEDSHAGACHCGAVKFEFRGQLSRATTCTCSICSRIGAVWHATDDARLVVRDGEDALSVYQFGTMTAKHYFCRHCGVHPFSRPRINPKIWVVNLRCVSGVNLDDVPTSAFDGANWETAAQALLARSRGQGPA
jgi:hypothetical protein